VPVSVLLVDDVVEIRSVLRQRLRLRGGFEVVAEAGDGAAAVTAATLHQPDLIVLDLGLPDLAGHEVLTQLRAVALHAQVVVYTGSVSRDRFALARDVDAYVAKDQDVTYLVELLVELGRQGRQAATLDVGPKVSDVGLARRFLVAHCERWGCEDVLEDAQLVVSELVTNALLHAENRCQLGIVFRSGWLRIEIRDRGSGGPEVQAADAQSEHGRGLLLVSAVSSAWGVEPLEPAGKIVWAELRSGSEPAANAEDPEAEPTWQTETAFSGRPAPPDGPSSGPESYAASA
jgi:CheY-like chemotaxis protein/anti-sigma regulatory factor (Ser/Thr protein kinase)